MKKILIAFGCLLACVSAKAQSQKTVVYIPTTNVCYESTGISVVSNGQTLTLKINNATRVDPTRGRLMSASDCTRGEFRNDDTQGGTHTIDCDVTVNATCFCTGVK